MSPAPTSITAVVVLTLSAGAATVTVVLLSSLGADISPFQPTGAETVIFCGISTTIVPAVETTLSVMSAGIVTSIWLPTMVSAKPANRSSTALVTFAGILTTASSVAGPTTMSGVVGSTLVTGSKITSFCSIVGLIV